jgi:hypothetical protein
MDVAPHVDFSAGYLPISMAVGDLDGDGKSDLVFANFNSNIISILPNTSSSGLVSFATTLTFPTGANPYSIAIGDIDGDGKPDLAVTNLGSANVSLFRNTSSIGTIDFAIKVDFATGSNPRSVAIGDINGDGKPDLAIANFGNNTASVLRNTSSNSTISFATKVDFTTGSGPYSVAIGDIDGNGKLDLAITNYYDSSVSVARNTSSTNTITFATRVNFATGLYPQFVAVGDLDGDNKPDLAIANTSSSNSVSVIRNTSISGTIGFAAKVDFTMISFPKSIAIGDIDGDGKPDLAVANGGNYVSAIRNTSNIGTISFATRVDFLSGANATSVAISDIDGDGKPDLNVANRNNDNVAVFRNNPNYPPPTIISYAPTSGAVGTNVNITGTLFNPLPANNVVFFGATRATVITATDTSLTVIVPSGATFAPITILNTGTNAATYSSQFFKPTFSPNLGFITAADIAPKVDLATGIAPTSIAIGDFDGDGKADLVTVNANNGSVSILRNTSINGVISYASKVDFAVGNNPISVAIGDLDGDGKLDLAVVNFYTTVSILRNTSSIGTVSFAPKVDFTTGPYPYSAAIGDLDGDGKPDLAVVNTGEGNVSVLRNTCTIGSVNFATKVDFEVGLSPASVAIGDLNEDGKPDLAVANSISLTVSILRNTSSIGMLNFAFMVNYSVGSNPRSVAIGDINGDGKFDLAIANRNGASVSLLRNIGSGGIISFDTKVDFVTGSNPNQVAIGDLDGDGKLDLAIANDGSDSISVLHNTTSSGYFSFASKVDFITGSNPKSVAIGDLNGDGKPDLAIANYNGNSISVLRNYPKFIPTITSFTPTSAAVGNIVTITGSLFNPTPANNIVFFGATRATVNSATKTSLVVTVPPGATFSPLTELNTSINLVGYSSGFFNPTYSPNKAMVNSSDLSNKVDFGTSLRPESVVVGDIDGDGKPDLAIVNDSSNTVSILRNTGNSGIVSFAIKLDFVTGFSPTSLAIGDIDGDGKLDLAITNNGSNTISILRNTSTVGSISFATKVDYATGINPRSAVIGDFDGDGKPDLAIANESSSNVSILRNTGSYGVISFSGKVDYTAGSNPKSLSIGDLDGDGRYDLAIANYNSNTVSVFRNTSNIGVISFANKIDLITGSNPQSIAVGDLDSNGKSDLVITNYSGGNISIFRNKGNIDSINFAPKLDFGTGINPRSIAIGDIDGDGKPDLAVANNNNNNVSVLRNFGLKDTINFVSKVDFGTGSGPSSVALGDMDGDGKLDLVVANRDSNSISVLRNNPQPPPTISSIYPTNGEVGDTVLIRGAFFNNLSSNNIVFFGATRAILFSSTDTCLTVKVPTGATFAPITVLNIGSGFSAYSKQFFNPIFSPNKGSITTSDINPKVDFTTGTNPRSVAIGDIDGDGKPDLAIANYSSNTVSVLRNTSSSGIVSFATKVDFATGSAPSSVAIGDINGDGKPDLVVTNNSSNDVSVFRNTGSVGTISFNTKVDFGAGSFPGKVAIGDIDGDGRPDLAVTNFYGDNVSVLRNIGSSGIIGFATKVDFLTGSYPSVVAIGDLNGDGKLDLAIGNTNNSSISVLRNTSSIGTITFATHVSFSTGQSPYALAIGDLDGDGKLDIAVGAFTSERISIFRNTSIGGSINFTTTVYNISGSEPHALAIGDIDGDSKPEVAITDAGAYVSIMRNTSVSGTISFASMVNFGVSSFPLSLAIGDLDGDGRSDFAATNYNSNTVSVLRNNPQYSATITIRGSLNQFNSCTGTASATQPFTIEGVGLTANIVVTAPTGFEVSTNSSFAFGSNINLTQTGGIVNRTIIFARLKSSATGLPSGNIICTSTGATTKNVAATGLLKATSSSITNVSICPNDLPYIWNGRTYNTSLIDTIYLTNSLGCDSFNIINLSVKPISTSISNIKICPNDLPYNWNSRTYNTSATDTIHLTNVVGCDSVTILKLTLEPTSTSTTILSICPTTLPYTWNGRTYYTNRTDTVYLTNVAGCDSITILKLTVKPTSISLTNISICQSSLPYTWNGRSYNANRIDTVYLINSFGCDSLTILNLTVKPTSTSTTNLSICQSSLPYTWNGLIFNSGGTQTKTSLTNSVGCDSSATLNLTVNPSPNTSNIVGLANATKLDTSSYSVIGLSGSVFNWIVSGAAIQSGAGSNQIQVKWLTTGIDTIKVTETSNQGCIGTQKSLFVTVSPGTGINELKLLNQVIIYPNPFSEMIFISLLGNLKLEKAIIYDLLGKEIIISNKDEIDVSSLKSGEYLMMVVDTNGNSYSRKLIKN